MQRLRDIDLAIENKFKLLRDRFAEDCPEMEREEFRIEDIFINKRGAGSESKKNQSNNFPTGN